MSITITINGTPIAFPSSAESPNWAPALIEFAQAVEAGLNATLGPYDVAPQTQIIDAQNPGTDVEITNLSFPTSAVVGAFIRYSVVRETSTENAYEAGNILITYNPDGPIGNKWEFSRDYIGDGKISFSITDAGQMLFTTELMGGLNHSGKIIFSAQAQNQV